MTPFDYDPNYAYDDRRAPLDRLEPAGATATHRVWGCKRPELLITETLAFHDRRTEDTDQRGAGDPDDDGELRRPPSKRHDPNGAPTRTSTRSIGRRGRCSSSCTIRRRRWSRTRATSYNGAGRTVAPDEDHDRAGRRASKGSPVWRMLVAVAAATALQRQPDPDDPISTNPQPNVEREVYFVDPTQRSCADRGEPGQPGKAPGAVLSDQRRRTTTVAPGGYAVIGPGEPAAIGGTPTPKRTYIGFRNGQTPGNADQRRGGTST